ncbi:MAG TPA: magnesium transporter CorA family protein [bacterium]|nr:magnesium transporter CorA family protein [bacterium]
MLTIYRKSFRSQTLAVLDELQEGVWINAVDPTAEEMQFLEQKAGVPRDFIEASLDTDERPRHENEDGIQLFILRVPIPKESDFRMYPLGIIMTENAVVTICLKENDILGDFIQERMKKFFTTKKYRFFLQIIKNSNWYYDFYVQEMRKDLKKIEHKLMQSQSNRLIVALLGIEENFLYFHTAVLGNEKMFEKILQLKYLEIYDDDRELLEDLIIENKEIVESLSIYNNLVSNTMDAYMSIISNNLNVTMKFLASVTIILSIPTIIASFLGMNVTLPGGSHPLAFYYALGIAGLLMAATALLFARKNYF